MRLKKLIKGGLLILIVIFIALLLIAIGVRYENALNEWNNKAIKGEVEPNYSNLYLNNYIPSVTSWDLSDQLGDQQTSINQYGKEVFLGGLITGAKVDDRKIYVGFNSGLILELSENGKVLKKVSVTPLLNEFALDQSNGGIRSFIWIDNEIVFVYYTSKNPTKDKYYIRAALIDLKNMIITDDIQLGEFSPSEHFALGGGGFFEAKDNSIFLAIGAAAGADNLTANAKSQDSSSFFGKVIKILIANNKSKLIKPSIFSKGHRNPQGMVSINNKFFAVEHGPKGGDEINILYKNGNYGWNRFSYGTKYGKPDKSYNKFNSNFIEPIFYFTPSIGISDIDSCPEVLSDPGYKDCLLISSMKDKSFYIAKLNIDKSRVQSLERINFGSRIRKIRSSAKSLYLFTDSQSIIKINYDKLL
jgi:hypothetical protein